MDNENDRIDIYYTKEFKRNIRKLSRKYRHIKSDVQSVINDLKRNNTPGDKIPNIGYTVYKMRVKNSDISKGKRSGYRLIYYIKLKSEIILVTIYSKSEQGDIPLDKLKKIINEFS